MPNWADDEGRYWYTPPGANWWVAVEVPHPPVSVKRGCRCRFCLDKRNESRGRK